MRIWIAIIIAGTLFSVNAVDFKKDIQPLLKNKCSRCHSGHEAKGGLSLNTRADILKGGESGTAAMPGKAAKSLILQRVTASDPDERMPDCTADTSAAPTIAPNRTRLDVLGR